MIWRGNQYVRGWVSIPDMVLAISWIALWIVWPSGVDQRIEFRTPSKTKMGYTMIAPGDTKLLNRPDDFIALNSMGRDRLEDARAPEQLTVSSTRPPMLLERQGTDRTASRSFVTVAPAFPEMDEARILPPIEPVFPRGADTNLHVVVSLSDELRKHNFQMPEFRFEPSRKVAGPWLVVIYVETGEDGEPEHVFLETGCDDQKINDAAVKFVARGRLADSGAKCEGRVTINYGTR